MSKRKSLIMAASLAIVYLMTGGVIAASLAEFDLGWHVIAGGGGHSSSVDYALDGSAGQPAAGALSGGDFTLGGGFWGGGAAQLPTMPGDCNGDGEVGAGDISALVLEIFDGDGDDPADTPGGTFLGNPVGCDANEDSVVSAGDISYTVLLIFGGSGERGGGSGLTLEAALSLPLGSAALSNGPALVIPDQVPASPGGTVTLPINFTANGHDICALTFSVDYDQTWLSFDPTDSNGDGIPDSVSFNLPSAFGGSVTFDGGDTDGELDFFIADTFPPLAALSDGTVVYVTLNVGSPPSATEVAVSFSQDPAASFGNTEGQDVPGTTDGGSVAIAGGATATATSTATPTSTPTPTDTPTTSTVTPTSTATPTPTTTPTMTPTPTGTLTHGHLVYLPLILKNYPELLLVFRDDFNDTTWDYPWGVLNEDPSLYSLTAHPGFLRIMTHPGRVGEKNLFEMWAPTGDFEIRTRLFFSPTSDFQVAGLVVSETRRNYLMLGRAHCDVPPPSCVGSGIYFERVEADQSLGSNFATSTTGQEEVYLRVVRQSSTYSGYYSEDGVNWTLVGSHTPSLQLSMVGITAAQDFADIGIPADFDYFEVWSYSTPARTTTLTWTSTLSKAASRKCEADCFSLLDYLRSRESVSNWEPILACQRLHQIVVIGE